MRKSLSASPLAVCALGALGLFGCSSGLVQSGLQPVDQPPAPTQGPTEHANGIVQDWSTQHAVFPSVGPINSLIALQQDPRALLAWQEAQRENALRARNPVRFPDIVQRDVHQDWNISLGSGGVANAMYPAKFTFDITAAPTCTAVSPSVPDFAVFPVDVAGGAAQPNIVAFDNLYSGTTPTNGICNRAPSGSDTGVAATTFWSYNITAAGGLVATSPSLSLDGTKVVFVETGSSTTAHFHVLAWKAGDGVNAANLQSVLSPKQITSGFSATQPAAGSGSVTDLALNTGTTQSDTLSSPFIDYTNDLAYVGNDSGILFRIKNVLCITAACTGGGSPAPSLDASWGTGGALTIGGTCTGQVSGPVIDSATGHVFVGCADGELYGFTNTGTALASSPVIVGSGSGSTGGAIVDPPIIDAVNKFVYAVDGASSGSRQVVVQASTVDLSASVTATLGVGEKFSMHDPAFNNAYFNGGGTAFLYAWGLDDSTGTEIALYGITFGAGMAMNSGTPANVLTVGGSTDVELSPVTEFFNGGTSVDAIFVGGLISSTPNFLEANVSAGFPAGFSASAGSAITGSGAGGIIIDNQSSSAQASSIYFGTLGVGGNNAVKLTQAALQ